MLVSTLLVCSSLARAVLGEVTGVLLLLSSIRTFCCGWAFFETANYYRMMRRRSALGLADPLVTNRFLLWSIWTGSMAILPLFLVVTRVLAIVKGAGVDPLHGVSGANQLSNDDPMLLAALGVIASTGLAAIAALWLCFFPTDAYASWIRSGHSGEGAT